MSQLPRTMAGRMHLLMALTDMRWNSMPWWKRVFLNREHWERKYLNLQLNAYKEISSPKS